MLSFDQLLMLIDKVGLCGVTFLLLVLHMGMEERTRRTIDREIKRQKERKD